MDGRMDGWTDGRTDGWMGGWMGEWMDGWVDEWIDGLCTFRFVVRTPSPSPELFRAVRATTASNQVPLVQDRTPTTVLINKNVRMAG